jgi:hypothetical protein
MGIAPPTAHIRRSPHIVIQITMGTTWAARRGKHLAYGADNWTEVRIPGKTSPCPWVHREQVVLRLDKDWSSRPTSPCQGERTKDLLADRDPTKGGDANGFRCSHRGEVAVGVDCEEGDVGFGADTINDREPLAITGDG